MKELASFLQLPRNQSTIKFRRCKSTGPSYKERYVSISGPSKHRPQLKHTYVMTHAVRIIRLRKIGVLPFTSRRSYKEPQFLSRKIKTLHQERRTSRRGTMHSGERYESKRKATEVRYREHSVGAKTGARHEPITVLLRMRRFHCPA